MRSRSRTEEGIGVVFGKIKKEGKNMLRGGFQSKYIVYQSLLRVEVLFFWMSVSWVRYIADIWGDDGR